MRLERGFASVVLDVDSTLCGIEGIDWLAARHGADIGHAVAELTDRAMRGEMPLGAAYGARLALVRPSRDDIAALAVAYDAAIAPSAPAAIAQMHRAGRRIVLVSGGLRDAILPVSRRLGLADDDVHGVDVHHDEDGAYRGYDLTSPLTQSSGKADVVQSLGLVSRALAVGDGSTDLAMRRVVDAFAAFTGFVTRPAVVSRADVVITSFDHLVELVLA